MKQCSKCGAYKLEKEFYKDKSNKNGLRCQCISCCKQYRQSFAGKLSHKKYNETFKGRLTQKKRRQSLANKLIQKAYKQSFAGKESRKKYWQSSVGKLARKRSKEKILSTFKGKLSCNISNAIRRSLKQNSSTKNGCHWETLVGFTVGELKKHLESQFKNGMNWGNYGHGKDKWCIDHGVPIAYFNYDSPEHPEFRVCWGLSNLHPMWCSENFSKGARTC